MSCEHVSVNCSMDMPWCSETAWLDATGAKIIKVPPPRSLVFDPLRCSTGLSSRSVLSSRSRGVYWEIRYGGYTADIRPFPGWDTADQRPSYGWYTADIRPINSWQTADILPTYARYLAENWHLGHNTKSSYDIDIIIVLKSVFGRISAAYSAYVGRISVAYIGCIASS